VGAAKWKGEQFVKDAAAETSTCRVQWDTGAYNITFTRRAHPGASISFNAGPSTRHSGPPAITSVVPLCGALVL